MEKMSSRLENQNVTRLNKTQLITKLIRLYQANECLWNPKSPGYHNLALKENAWRRISYFFKDDRLTVEQLKLMIISLRYYYERERLAIIANKLNGVYYAPRHSYYNKLHFMNPENETLKVLMVFLISKYLYMNSFNYQLISPHRAKQEPAINKSAVSLRIHFWWTTREVSTANMLMVCLSQ